MSDIVRTFRAPDPRSALDAVKAALGSEAVILETREVGGIWGRAEIEVTAMRSLDEAGAPVPPENMVQAELVSLRRVVDDLRTRLDHGGGSTGGGAEPRNAVYGRDGTRGADREPRRAPGPDAVPSDIVGLVRQLVRRGVEPRMAEEIVQEAMRGASFGRGALDEAIRMLVTRKLNAAAPPWERDERRVVALVGPTGVGKTTTIAKIAAKALLEARLRVALVTVDTYRIGACEHLGRYGDIMGLKTQVARDAPSLAAAIARAKDADLVLVDSAGRSDLDTIAAQMGLLRSIPELELYLVLSAASGSREIAAAARRYRDLGVNRLVFSKLDEADGPGSILSATAVLPRPISCVTNGQRVPDDLQAANGNFLVDLVCGPARSKEPSWTKQKI